MLIEQDGPDGTTRILIDTSPDMRSQLLDAEVGALDAVVYTHSHADHVHGLDDIRMIVYNMRARLNVWADEATQKDLYARFGYAFIQPEGSNYPPICEMNTIDGDVTIDGAGGPVTLTPFYANHGMMDALGFRIGDLAYLPDVAELFPNAWEKLTGLDTLIIDALRRTPHPTHLHLEKTLEYIDRIAPKNAVLTNMHIDLDYATLDAEILDHITTAYDMMTLTQPL